MVGYAGCAKCHSETGMSDPLESIALARGTEWVAGHVTDPEMIAPGLREPPTVRSEREVAAIVAYVRRISRQPYPGFPANIEAAAPIWARYCVGCHVIDGDGGKDGPELTHIGGKHDLDKLKTWIIDPEKVNPDADMPAFGKRLTPQQLDAIAQYLATRK
jgi:mono/diheme cytochrome c family protein